MSKILVRSNFRYNEHILPVPWGSVQRDLTVLSDDRYSALHFANRFAVEGKPFLFVSTREQERFRWTVASGYVHIARFLHQWLPLQPFPSRYSSLTLTALSSCSSESSTSTSLLMRGCRSEPWFIWALYLLSWCTARIASLAVLSELPYYDHIVLYS